VETIEASNKKRKKKKLKKLGWYFSCTQVAFLKQAFSFGKYAEIEMTKMAYL
jgi:hypothetical protein